MTAKELIEKYGEPQKFVDSWGIMNYAVPREAGIDDAMKIVCYITKEPAYKMCICYAKDDGDVWRFKVKDSDYIIISRLRIEKDAKEKENKVHNS